MDELTDYPWQMVGWLLTLSKISIAGSIMVPEGAIRLHPTTDPAVVREPRAGGGMPDPALTVELVSYELPVRETAPPPTADAQCAITLTVVDSTTSADAPISCGGIEGPSLQAAAAWRFRVVEGDPTVPYSIALVVRFKANERRGDVDIWREVMVQLPEAVFEGLHFTGAVQPKRRVRPSYPREGRGTEATCNVYFDITESGVPDAVRVEDCPPEFAESAERAAWKWRFKRYLVEGQPVRTSYILEVKFEQ